MCIKLKIVQITWVTILFKFCQISCQRLQKKVDLVCEKTREKIDDVDNPYIHMKIVEHNLHADCPCAYDYTGKCRHAAYMCTASTKTFICDFRLDNIIITKKGGMVAYKGNLEKSSSDYIMISMNHPTIKGSAPLYFSENHDLWASKYIQAVTANQNRITLNHDTINKLPVHNLVVPLRMAWDDCFNHLSFQTLPLIGHAYTAYKDTIWNDLSWHTSLFSGALISLLDIPLHRIIIEENILAKQVALPWVQGWCPLQISGLPNAAREVSKIMRQNLLKIHMQKSNSTTDAIYSIPLLGDDNDDKHNSHLQSVTKHGHNKNKLYSAHKNSTTQPDSTTTQEKRTIVYFTRNSEKNNGIRAVVNEKAIIHYIQKYLSHDYEFIMAGHTDAYQNIEALHQSWARYATVVSRASVILGPHGGGFNNLMWAPDDVNIVEFNLFPDEDKYDKQNYIPVRHVFLTAAYSKGVDKYWIVDPSMSHPKDFYAGKMRIPILDLMIVLKRIGVLKTNYDPQKDITLSTEKRGKWTIVNGKPNLDFIPSPIVK